VRKTLARRRLRTAVAPGGPCRPCARRRGSSSRRARSRRSRRGRPPAECGRRVIPPACSTSRPAGTGCVCVALVHGSSRALGALWSAERGAAGRVCYGYAAHA
jgi:hypothetical protein